MKIDANTIRELISAAYREGFLANTSHNLDLENPATTDEYEACSRLHGGLENCSALQKFNNACEIFLAEHMEVK